MEVLVLVPVLYLMAGVVYSAAVEDEVTLQSVLTWAGRAYKKYAKGDE